MKQKTQKAEKDIKGKGINGKTIFGVICVILAAIVVIAAGVGSSWFTNGNIPTWFNYWGKGAPKLDSTEGMTDDEIAEAVNLSLPTYVFGVDDVQTPSAARYAMRASTVQSADVTLQLSSDVLSDVALEKLNVAITWSWAWDDSPDNSPGDINDYFYIAENEDFTRTASLVMKQPFNKGITVTATLKDYPTKKAQMNVGCLERYPYTQSQANSFYLDFDDPYCIELPYNYNEVTVGTVRGDFELAMCVLNVDSGFVDNLKSLLKFDVSFKSCDLTNLPSTTVTLYRNDSRNTAQLTIDGKTIEYSDFISDWNSLTNNQKNAVYYAWYEAAKTYGYNINFDVSVNYNYDGKNISGYEAMGSLGQLTGSAFGYDVSEFLDLSLVNKVL